MSQKNAEKLVQQVLDAMNERDPDAVAALCHPDIEFHSALASAVEGRIYRGREGLRSYFDDINDTFGEVHWDRFEVAHRNEDELVLVLHVNARGRTSGVPLDRSMPQVWTFRDGKPWRNVVYQSLDEALEAVGLSE